MPCVLIQQWELTVKWNSRSAYPIIACTRRGARTATTTCIFVARQALWIASCFHLCGEVPSTLIHYKKKQLEFLAAHEERPQHIEGIGWTEPSLWCLHACIPSKTHLFQWHGHLLASLRLRQSHLLLAAAMKDTTMPMLQFDPEKKSWS